MPPDEIARQSFAQIIEHSGTRIIGAQTDGKTVSMATLHLLPNMTYGGRPYGLVENVVTLPSHEGRGFGRAVMEAVEKIAWDAGAYKIMLLTGRANAAKGFYEALGYSANEKHGMMMRRA